MDDKKRKEIGGKIVRGLVRGARGAKLVGELMQAGLRYSGEGLQETSDWVVDIFFIIRPPARQYDND